VVLADQIRTLDWRARQADFIGRVDSNTLAEVIVRFSALIGEL
jgi:mRNA interferase MazF